MHQKKWISAGAEPAAGGKVLVMLHGRGGSAEDILSLSDYLAVEGFALLAPQATNHTWYPLSFLAPPEQNEPWLSSALALLKDGVEELEARGIPSKNIYFLGFSQGACLALEFVTREARHWGGVAAFTGGLIGNSLRTENYGGDFAGTPVFIGTADPDPHVPVERAKATADLLRNMHADIHLAIYPGMGHTIGRQELAEANARVFG